jgi:hypothetical protein
VPDQYAFDIRDGVIRAGCTLEWYTEITGSLRFIGNAV